MNRHEFYDSLNKYKSLSHTQYGNGYVHKIDNFYGWQKPRYFYSEEEWQAYQKEKNAEKEKRQELVDKAYKHNNSINIKNSDAYKKNEAAGKATDHDRDRYLSNWEKGIDPKGYQQNVYDTYNKYSSFMDHITFSNYLEKPWSSPIANCIFDGYDNKDMEEAKKAIKKAMNYAEKEGETFKEKLEKEKDLNSDDKKSLMRFYEQQMNTLNELYEITKDEESFNNYRKKIIKERAENQLYNKNAPYANVFTQKDYDKINELYNGNWKDFIEWKKEDLKTQGADDFYINQSLPYLYKGLSKIEYIYFVRNGYRASNDEWDWIFENK